MPTVPTLRLFVRSLRYDGYSSLQILEAMTQRLALDRFDPATLGKEDRQKYEELAEFLRGLERPTLQ